VVVLHVLAHLGSTKYVTDNVVLVSDELHIYIIKPNIYMLQCINGLSSNPVVGDIKFVSSEI